MDFYEPVIYVGILVFAIVVSVTAVFLIIRATIRQSYAAIELQEATTGEATELKTSSETTTHSEFGREQELPAATSCRVVAPPDRQSAIENAPSTAKTTEETQVTAKPDTKIPDNNINTKTVVNHSVTSTNNLEAQEKPSTQTSTDEDTAKLKTETRTLDARTGTPEQSHAKEHSDDVGGKGDIQNTNTQKRDAAELASLLEGEQPEALAEAPEEEPQTAPNEKDIMSLFVVENDEESPASLLAVDLFEIEVDGVLKLSKDVSALFKANNTTRNASY